MIQRALTLLGLALSISAHSPAGLKEKITEWAEVAVSRSHYLWEFRSVIFCKINVRMCILI
jgi:hypothetical protein